MGFDGLLRERAARLRGILNGIDTDVWNPADDPRLAVNYDARAPYARAANKVVFQQALGLNPEPDTLVAGIISRLSWQKGLDLLLDNLPVLLEEGCNSLCLAKATRKSKPGSARRRKSFPGGLASVLAMMKRSRTAFRQARMRCLCRRASSLAA